VTALEVIVRLAWLALIVWGAWRIGVALLALPWRFKRHPQRFGGYLRDAFVANEPFIFAFVLVWASVPLGETLGFAQITPLVDIATGVVVIALGLPIGAIRRAQGRIVASSGAAR